MGPVDVGGKGRKRAERYKGHPLSCWCLSGWMVWPRAAGSSGSSSRGPACCRLSLWEYGLAPLGGKPPPTVPTLAEGSLRWQVRVSVPTTGRRLLVWPRPRAWSVPTRGREQQWVVQTQTALVRELAPCMPRNRERSPEVAGAWALGVCRGHRSGVGAGHADAAGPLLVQRSTAALPEPAGAWATVAPPASRRKERRRWG